MNNTLTISSEKSLDKLVFNLIKEICKRDKIKIPYENNGISDNFFRYLSGTTIETAPPPTGIWRKKTVNKSIYQKEMFASAVEMLSSQAIMLFTEMVINGDFDQPGKRKIVFIKEMYNHKPLILIFGSKSIDLSKDEGISLSLREFKATEFYPSEGIEWYGCE